QNRRARERVDVAQRVQRPVIQAEQRRLTAVVEQHTDAAAGDQGVVRPGGCPHPSTSSITEQRHNFSSSSPRYRGIPMGTGTLRPACSVNDTVEATASGALTKETKRDSLSGSSSTPFHSHA